MCGRAACHRFAFGRDFFVQLKRREIHVGFGLHRLEGDVCPLPFELIEEDAEDAALKPGKIQHLLRKVRVLSSSSVV